MTGPSPLERAPAELVGGRDAYLKREDTHELGAFKWRGALPTLREHAARDARTVVTASTGNHGAATAWAARELGMTAIVYAPEHAPRAKMALIESLGAEMRLTGADLDEAKDAARAFAAASELPFFEDGAEPAQYLGYRSIAREVLEQLGRAPAALVVPLGNGALLGGIGLELADRSPSTLAAGVQSREAPVMVECWQAGRVVESDRSETFADGLAVRVAIPHAVDVLARVAGRMLLVSERAIAEAVGAYARAGIRVEGAAAAALAALPQLGDVPDPLVLVVTGRNIDDELWRRAVDRPESFPD
ncbi:MAG: pyridoxal-phosphate dependent enzyme [Thermoleophilia bacterium]|nr:pyridoxal-phosphate dependent enzyme [Thermoleophilia bacterium]